MLQTKGNELSYSDSNFDKVIKLANRLNVNWVLVNRILVSLINLCILGFGLYWEINELHKQYQIAPYGVILLSAYSVLSISIISHYTEKYFLAKSTQKK